MSQFSEVDKLAISTIKLLSVDQVDAAQSGHPGAPLGLAAAAHVLWKQMRTTPDHEKWINRDRFVLSNGHACALLYSILHLVGYDYSIDDLKHFRHINSKTPGHPEFHLPGVELTTGPLGQGISNAVGLAIAQANFAATYNQQKFTISDNYTFVFAGDGCLQEGVSSEACSLAGHLQLGNLIVIYDCNNITIDGDTNLSFTEDVLKRYESYGWDILTVPNGNEDLDGIAKSIEKAKTTKEKPTIIKLETVIGYGSLQEGTGSVHGSALKKDDIKQLKKKLGFDPEKQFVVPQEVYDLYHKIGENGNQHYQTWNTNLQKYKKQYPKLGAELSRRLESKLPDNWDAHLPTYKPTDSAVATRKLSHAVLEKIFSVLPELIGGSADLTPSNLTRWDEAVDFQSESSGIGSYKGRYLRYGIREHGMSAIMNGIGAYGANYKPFGGTFLNFVSYAAGSVRLAALSRIPTIWVATHDSIGLGEDGPTHQPIETLTHFRALPNVHVWRPADGNEVSAAYKVAIESYTTPSIIALSRQNLPQLEGTSIEKAVKGGYILQEPPNGTDTHVIIISTGSEVSLAVETAKKLQSEKQIGVRVVSMPDFYSFDKQPWDYRHDVLPDGIPVVALEVQSIMSWGKYAHEAIGLDKFGLSGKSADIYKYFGFVADSVAEKVEKVIDFYKGQAVKSPINKALNQDQL